DHLRQTLSSYDEPLLRQVAGSLCKPRSQWPAEELIDRSVQTVGNPAVIDRRLRDLAPEARRLLGLVGHSRQPRWPVGSLVELGVALGATDGLAAVQILLDAGLLYPDLGQATSTDKPGRSRVPRVKGFDTWLGQAGAAVFAHPAVSARAVGM